MSKSTTQFAQPHNLLKPGARLGADGRFTVASAPKLGRGQFAEVYAANDATRDGARVAVKVESEHRTSAREARVMRAMAGKEHFAELLLESSHEGKPFLAMELVGENLADLRSRARGGRFGPRTTCAIAIAMLDALESMHGAGYVHRDIKPGNVCVGNGKEGMKRLYLIDFGLARKFTDDDGNVLPERDDATFRGTTTYASVYAHENKEQSARDDLFSALYVLVEAHEGVLPWKAGEEKMSKQNVEREKKKCVKNPALLCPKHGCPTAIETFARAIATLEYGQTPDYAALRAPFEDVVRNAGDTPLDWEAGAAPPPSLQTTKGAPPPPPVTTYAAVAAANADAKITGHKRERDQAPPPLPPGQLVRAARFEPSSLPPHIADTVRNICFKFSAEEALAIASGAAAFVLENALEGAEKYPLPLVERNFVELREIIFEGIGEIHRSDMWRDGNYKLSQPSKFRQGGGRGDGGRGGRGGRGDGGRAGRGGRGDGERRFGGERHHRDGDKGDKGANDPQENRSKQQRRSN
jgi:tau tubulin kinase